MKRDFFWPRTHEYDIRNEVRYDSIEDTCENCKIGDGYDGGHENYRRYDVYAVDVVKTCNVYARSAEAAVKAVKNFGLNEEEDLVSRIEFVNKFDVRTLHKGPLFIDDYVDAIQTKLYLALELRGFTQRLFFEGEYNLEEVQTAYDLLRLKCSCIYFVREHYGLRKTDILIKRIWEHFGVNCSCCVRGQDRVPECKERLKQYR